MHGIVLQVGEIETVGDAEIAFRQIHRLKAYILVGILHLRHTGMRCAVGAYQSVAQEVTVARRVHAKVSAIGIEGTAILLVGLQESLIHPIPDESTLQVGIFIDGLPLIPEVTRGVTHRMGILRGSDGAVAAFPADLFQPLRTGVLGHVHIGVPLPQGPLVVDGTVHAVLLPMLYIKVGLIEVIAIARLVAERPEGDGGMILVALIHIDGTIHVR